MKFPTITSSNTIGLLAIVLSCLLSVFSISTNPLLNDDAYGYLRAAEIFNIAGIDAVLDSYGWYGYSILIALADLILPGSLLLAAHLLNTASFALLVFSFIKISCEFSSDQSHQQRIQFFAAATILAFPLLNEMRFFLIRDFAFWAFTLLSLQQLIVYQRNGLLRSAICWSLAVLIAILFRLEGILLAIFVPFSLLLGTTANKGKRFLTLICVLFASILLVLMLAFLLQINLLELMQYAYRYYLPLLFNLGTVLTDSALNVNTALFTVENFPGTDNVGYGLMIAIFAYFFTVVANLVNALSVPFTVLLLFATWHGHLHLPHKIRWLVLSYIGCTLLGLLLFLFIMHFLTQRYAALLCILLLTLVPGALNSMYEKALANHSTKRFLYMLGIFCVYFSGDSLISFGYSQHYLKEASDWSVSNLPAATNLHTNHYAIAYNSKRIEAYDKISLSAASTITQSKRGDYLMLAVRQSESEIRALLDANQQLQLITRFSNTRGDEVRVYQQQ